jgi:hypothetical protein
MSAEKATQDNGVPAKAHVTLSRSLGAVSRSMRNPLGLMKLVHELPAQAELAVADVGRRREHPN